MVMAATPSPQQVGREFVRQYYTILHEAPEILHRFYSSGSTFVHGGIDRPGQHAEEPVIGQLKIDEKIKALGFKDCHTKIRQVDSQATIGSGVVVQVTGELSNNGEPMRRFMQTFVLAPQTPKKYYVHNDIFRYQDEVYQDLSDTESDEPQQVSQVNENHLHHHQAIETVVAEPAVNVNVTTASTGAHHRERDDHSNSQALMNGHLHSASSTTSTSSSSASSIHPSSAVVHHQHPHYQEQEQQQQQQHEETIDEQQPTVSVTLTSVVNAASIDEPSKVHAHQPQQQQLRQQHRQQNHNHHKEETTTKQETQHSGDAKINSWAKIITTSQNSGNNSSNVNQQSLQSNLTYPNLNNNNNNNNNNNSNNNSNNNATTNSTAPTANNMTGNQTSTAPKPQRDSKSGGQNKTTATLLNGGNGNKPATNQQQTSGRASQRGGPQGNKQGQQQNQGSQQQPRAPKEATVANKENGVDDLEDPEKRRYPDNQQIFVGNLLPEISDEELEAFFNQYGKVVEVRINVNNKQQSGRRLPNYGFIVFEDSRSVETLLGNAKSNNLTFKSDKGDFRVNGEVTGHRPGRGGGGNSSAGGAYKPNRATRSTSNNSNGGAPAKKNFENSYEKRGNNTDTGGSNVANSVDQNAQRGNKANNTSSYRRS